MKLRMSWFAFLLCALLNVPALAHEVRPGMLQLSETSPGQFDVLWKVPARGDRVLPIQPVFAKRCQQIAPPTSSLDGRAQVSRWRIHCGERGMDGAEIRIDGLDGTMIDVLVRAEFIDGVVVSRLLRPNDLAFEVNASGSDTPVWGYLTLGVEHILFGIDHLLFVLGLLLIVRGTWLLVKTITAFTVAHSITLGLATLGFVTVPQAPVEAVIALSIVFVASELARQRDAQAHVMTRYPWIVAFIFGLLHGFGFASALAEVGLPQTDIPLALLLFNVGVELGQLMFVGAVLGLVWLFHRSLGPTPAWMPRGAAYGIGSVAAFWVIERVAAIV
jgi:hydrogenase/urease accessory protein HupE